MLYPFSQVSGSDDSCHFFPSLAFFNQPDPFLSPDNNLFGAGNDSDSVGSKGDGTSPVVRQVPAGGAISGGAGLFEDDEDDFFSGKSQKKPGKCGNVPVHHG